MKPTGIALGTLGLIALTYQVFKPKAKPKLALSGIKKKNPVKKEMLSGLNGKKSKTKTKNKKQNLKKKPILLL